MSEINQLARAELALKNSLRVQCWMHEEWQGCVTTQGSDKYQHRVHPDEEAKLDAIIWEGARGHFTEAYLNQHGEIIFSTMRASGWTLIATREPPVEEWDESRIDVISQNGNEGLHYDAEEAQLLADLKEFAAYAGGYVLGCSGSPQLMKDMAKGLSERINPKPVCECCGQVLEKKDD